MNYLLNLNEFRQYSKEYKILEEQITDESDSIVLSSFVNEIDSDTKKTIKIWCC